MSNKVAATWHPDSVFIAPVDAEPPRGRTWLDRLLCRDPMRGWEEAGWLEEALADVVVVSECSVVAGSTIKTARIVNYAVDPRGRAMPARARIDVEVWLTRGEMAQRLDDVRVAADREFQLGLFELEVATANYSEHVALTLAGFCLARDDIPAALAVLRGWARNPRRLP